MTETAKWSDVARDVESLIRGAVFHKAFYGTLQGFGLAVVGQTRTFRVTKGESHGGRDTETGKPKREIAYR